MCFNEPRNFFLNKLLLPSLYSALFWITFPFFVSFYKNNRKNPTTLQLYWTDFHCLLQQQSPVHINKLQFKLVLFQLNLTQMHHSQSRSFTASSQVVYSLLLDREGAPHHLGYLTFASSSLRCVQSRGRASKGLRNLELKEQSFRNPVRWPWVPTVLQYLIGFALKIIATIPSLSKQKERWWKRRNLFLSVCLISSANSKFTQQIYIE